MIQKPRAIHNGPSAKMTEAGLTDIRVRLTRERATLLARVQGLEAEVLINTNESDGVPSGSAERENALTMVLDQRLTDIESALARLDAGTYGICTDCNSQIPPRRLEALPLAVLCVNCQSAAEKGLRMRKLAAR